MMEDFRQVILKQREESAFTPWTGTILDYLPLVKESPEIAQLAPRRLYNAIMSHGTNPVPDEDKIVGYQDLVEYNFFRKNEIYGSTEVLHDMMVWLNSAQANTETGRKILIFKGPVSSGKSSMVWLLKRALEQDKTPAYGISTCPLNEEPLHAIPYADRPYWEKELGVKIEGELCPRCVLELDKIQGAWETLPVRRFKFSELRRTGIGTFLPSDPKSQDVSELIGRVDMSKLHLHAETDPRAYLFNGELQVANRGLIDFIELLKTDDKLLYVLISVAQEKMLKSPGFPQMYIDTVMIAHTNQTEYDKFEAERSNEALHDRIYPIVAPCQLKVKDEIAIYEKLIRQSDFYNKIHIAPFALKVAAEFAILTRLTESKKVSSLLEKMKLYDGDAPDGFKREDIDIKELRSEGKFQGEGMHGISPRFVMNAINTALGRKADIACLNPIDVIRALHQQFEHKMGFTPEDVEKYKNFLKGEKDSALSNFKETAKKEVQLAFIHAYEDQAQAMFENYLINAEAYCNKEKVRDPILGEYSDPDEKLMRSIEELINVPINSVKEFRQGIFVQQSGCLKRGEEFTFKTYPPLREAIEKKLMSDLKNVVTLALADPTKTLDRKLSKRRKEALDRLMARGDDKSKHCEHCAKALLAYVGEVLRREG